MKTRSFVVIAFLLLAGAAFAISQNKPRMEDVASKLSCYCGTCPHLVVTRCGCGTAEQIKADVQKMIDSGMSEQQIIQDYVARYGQTVLSAPPKQGFQLTAWLFPFFAFAAGGVLLFTFLRRQQSAKSLEEPPVEVRDQQSEEEEHYRGILEQELDQRK